VILWRPEWGEYPFPCHLLEGLSHVVVVPIFIGDLEGLGIEGLEIEEENSPTDEESEIT
jgi:hypothetical protein